jgi:long-chain acyl-CoA synthetase
MTPQLAILPDARSVRPAPATLGAALAAAAAKRPGKVALRLRRGGASVEMTYAALVASARRMGERLASIGVDPGDRVAIVSENRPEWLAAYFGILEARGTAVPVDARLKEGDLRWILDRSEARAVLASRAIAAALSADLRAALAARDVPLLDLEGDLAPFEGAAAACGPRRAGGPDDRDPRVASLIFTSGTTGEPKGVLLTHEGFLANCRGGWEAGSFAESDEGLAVLPLHHVFEFTWDLALLTMAGATVTYVEAVKGDVILEAMRATGTTVMAAVPRLLELFEAGVRREVAARGALARAAFAAALGAARLGRRLGIDVARRLFRRVHERFGGRLRFFGSGAAPLDPRVEAFLEDLGFPIRQGYGLSETAPFVAINRLERRRRGTVGPPLPGVEVRIVAPDSRGEGEIAVRGASVMRGYFRDAAATRRAIRDGWFHTGDLGRLDERGHLVISGRVKDLIVTAAGKKVSPVEVESRLAGLAGVQEICVFGRRGAGLGEEVHAAVVADRAALPAGDEAALRRAIEERLAAAADARGLPSHMAIARVHLVPELPKTTTLKVKRQEVAALVAARAAAAPEAAPRPAPEGALEAQVMAVLRSVVGDRARGASLDSTLQFDLGMDSLERLELLGALEARLGARLPDEVAPALHRVRDVVAAAERHGAAAAPARDERALPPPRGLAALAALGAFGALARGLWRLRAEGLERLPSGPMILCPNHESHLDVFFVASRLPAEARRGLVSFGKREHFEARGTRLFAGLARAIPVDRDGDSRPALRLARRALEAGRPILIHPEGTRTKSGALGPFRAGAALLAIEAGVPLVPVKIEGAFAVYPPARTLPRLLDWRRARRREVVVRFGAPIAPPLARGDAREAAAALTGALRDAVAAL